MNTFLKITQLTSIERDIQLRFFHKSIDLHTRINDRGYYEQSFAWTIPGHSRYSKSAFMNRNNYERTIRATDKHKAVV